MVENGGVEAGMNDEKRIEAYRCLASRTLARHLVRLEKKLERAKQDNDRLFKAILCAHNSLTWSNTENQIPHAVWHLEQVFPKGTVSTAHAQADTDPLPFEPSKAELED